MRLIKEFPTLYGVSSTKKIKEWTVAIFENQDGTAVIQKRYGQVGKKITENNRTIKKGKNIGKSNETTPTQQALSEARSAANVKRDANHEFEIPNLVHYIPRVILPQLASNPRKGNIVFPCDMQPKLNGICCLSKKSMCYPEYQQYFPAYIEYKGLLPPKGSKIQPVVSYLSRGGQMFKTLMHLTNPLMVIMSYNEIIHGELYVHGWSLQKIGSYTKDLKPDAHLLEYWIYEKAEVGPPWIRRWNEIATRISEHPECQIKVCPTVTVNSYDEAKEWHDKWVLDGFEGGVLKNHLGQYMFEFRSKEIEKAKDYDEAEFVIVGGKEGVGNDEGCIVFRCSTENGNEFDVRPCGTVEKRKEYFRELDNLIGKKLTVKFAELSEDAIPLQPVGLAVRDYE